MKDMERALLAAHRGNVQRYRRMLASRLTEFEREFVEHRLFEVEDAIRQLLLGESGCGQCPESPEKAA
jgi:hypothetical protein